MTDEEILKGYAPNRTNISRSDAYLLAPDEGLLFDWLTFRQRGFCYKKFYYSRQRIEREIRVTRRPLERIVKRFSAMGILSTETKPAGPNGGRTTFYRFDFSAVVSRLSEIIDEKHTAFKDFKTYYSALARQQVKADKNALKKTAPKEMELSELCDNQNADELYEALCSQWQERITMYNNGQLTPDKPQRAKTYTQFPRTSAINASMARAMRVYESQTIKMAFIAFADEVLKGGTRYAKVNNLLPYFLVWNEQEGAFPVLNEYLEKFNQRYSRPND